MKKSIIIAMVTTLLWNCKEKKSESKDQIEVMQTQIEAPKLEKGCYRYDKNNNIILFQVEKTTDPVSGNLMYQLDGKDKNTGTFEGTVTEERLIGTYTFRSEGKESTREVAFQIKEGKLIEGYGPLNEEGTAFKSYDSIQFSSTMPLTKTKCDF